LVYISITDAIEVIIQLRRNTIIGLLCHDLTPVPFYNSCEDMHVRLIKFMKKGIDWNRKKIRGIALKNGKWMEAECSFPDCIYNRYYTSSKHISSRLEAFIGKGKVFNSFTLFDKYLVYKILSESKLKHTIIPSFDYRPDLLLSILRQKGTALIKPALGAMGSSVYKIVVDGSIFKLYLQTTLFPQVFHNSDELIAYIGKLTDKRRFIIQPFINFTKVKGQMFDVRMLVQKNGRGQWDITADMSRVCFKESFVSNFVYALQTAEEALAGIENGSEVLSTIEEISIHAANVLERRLGLLGEISVDFGIDMDYKPWIIEVNGKPYKQVFSEFGNGTFERVFRTPIEYALYLAKQ
jgi:hypothetical protein